MRIAVDIDGVVVDQVGALCKTFGLKLDYKKAPFPYNFAPLLGITNKTLSIMFEGIKAEDVELLPNVKEGLAKLTALGHQVFYLTRKTQPMIEWTRKVLYREGLDIYPLMVSSLKQYENCYDILIEDCGEVAEQCHKAGKNCVLIDQAWNREYTFPRYKDLLDFANKMEEWQK